MDRRASPWCVGVALAQSISCKPGNFVVLSLGTDMLCGEHPSGRWECFQPDEQGHARRFDIPRDDYLFVSPDGGSACAIRPEDSGVDCFGENAPTPPAMQVAELRYVAPDLILGIGLDGAAVSWGVSAGYQDVGGVYDSLSAIEGGDAAYLSGTTVEFPFWDLWEPIPDVVAYDIGSGYSGVEAWIGTDGCFHTDGTDFWGDISGTDCGGPFQPIVIGARAGAYALDEDGTIHQLDIVGSDGYGGSCPAPKGRFTSLARWGDLTCGLQKDGGLVCWEPNGGVHTASWVSELSGAYYPAGDATSVTGGFDRCG